MDSDRHTWLFNNLVNMIFPCPNLECPRHQGVYAFLVTGPLSKDHNMALSFWYFTKVRLPYITVHTWQNLELASSGNRRLIFGLSILQHRFHIWTPAPTEPSCSLINEGQLYHRQNLRTSGHQPAHPYRERSFEFKLYCTTTLTLELTELLCLVASANDRLLRLLCLQSPSSIFHWRFAG